MNKQTHLPCYKPNTDGQRWWCNVHVREATHVLLRRGMEPKPVCDPKLGGIMMPCQCSLFSSLVYGKQEPAVNPKK